MKNQFEDQIEEIIPELNLLTTAHSGITPGTVLESKEDDRVRGHLKNHLAPDPIAEARWETHKVSGSALFPEELAGNASREGGLKVLRFFGLNFQGSYDFNLDFDVSGFEVEKFATDLDSIDLSVALRRLRKDDRLVWRRLLRRYLVTEVWYATAVKLRIEAKTGAGVDLSANIKGVDVEARYEQTTESAGVLKFESKQAIPFGATGYQIRRFRLSAW